MIVVDASVWVASLLPDQVHHAESLAWVAARGRSGEQLIAPVVVVAEVGGAIVRRTGRPRLARRLLTEFVANPVLRMFPVEEDRGREAAGLAIDLRLRGTDAIYVALASELGVPLVTWDREQRERAASVITTMEPS